MEELKTNIKNMIVERLFLSVVPGEIPDDAPLMETFGIDSVALFELVVGLEEEFGVSATALVIVGQDGDGGSSADGRCQVRRPLRFPSASTCRSAGRN